MASRKTSALLVLALFMVVMFLQNSAAEDHHVHGADHGDEITVLKRHVHHFSTTDALPTAREFEDVSDEDRDLGMVDRSSEDDEEDMAGEGEGSKEEQVEIQPYLYVPDEDEIEVFPEDHEDGQQTEMTQDDQDRLSLKDGARMLWSYEKCWSKKECHNFGHKAGCCSKKCTDLSSDNKNCGTCKKSCDTKRGYFCKDGKCCKKPSPPPSHLPTCGYKNLCKYHDTCCWGKCENLQDDVSNCGKCGLKCPWGSACCNGNCKNLKSDSLNCGKCGRKCPHGAACCNGNCVWLKTDSNNCGKCGNYCGWGRTCCNGHCVSLLNDNNNCGKCGHRCPNYIPCKYGICGYGH